jgi:hypothetical protein
MNTGHLIYQAERTRSAAEQQEVDRSNAQLAVSIGRMWRALEAPVRSRRAWGSRGSRPAGLARKAGRAGEALGAVPITLGQQPARVWRRIAGGS